MSLPERLASIGSQDAPNAPGGRKEKDVEPPDPLGSGLVQRCVIIQRDERGYGFTVSGDNPVYVASVKPEGAASKAGVQQGDRIVKVNGTLVTSRNHMDVVKLIKSGSYVALTLLGKPHPSGHPGIITGSTIASQRDSVSGRVTAPQPVDPDKDRELWQQKVHMTRAMYETAREDFEKLQKQYVTKPSEKLHSQLLEKERTVKTLENQLKQLTGSTEEIAAPLNLVPFHNRYSETEHGGLDQSWASSLPASTTDVGSMSDSPQTSPSVSPTPNDPHSRHNGQDMEDSMSNSTQEIITIDDEDVHSEDDQMNDPGPFADIKLLESKPAHMAVLLNYLISNSDPSPVFFHIISDQYSKITASSKELRKWAYEIYSTFVVQSAPLSIPVEDSIINQIDNILTVSVNKQENENTLRNMFQTARQAVQNEISELLADFRSKKDLGMGNFYGIQKLHDNMDSASEIKEAEELLMPHLLASGTEDNSRGISDKDQAIAWALATFLRMWGGSKSVHSSTLDRVQTFMMKDKRSIKFPGSRSTKAKSVKGHQFSLQHFYVASGCSFCGGLIWGVGCQGYQCQSCEMTLHKQCADLITEVCGGKKKRVPKIPSWRFSTSNPGQQAPSTDKHGPGSGGAKSPPYTDPNTPVATQPYKQEDTELNSILSIIAGLPGGYSVSNIVQRYQNLGRTEQGSLGVPVEQQGSGQGGKRGSIDNDRRGSTDLNRSGSLNNKGEKGDRPARRAKSDVDVDTDTFKAINQSGSSSASSLSNRSMESPGNSTDNVNDVLSAQLADPDLDVEAELPPLKQVLGEDVLRKLKPKEKKRQEVINELFYTERAHLRNLKIIDLLFNRPMLNQIGIMVDLARALFPNMEEMISLHVTFVRDIKERNSSTPLVKDVGDLLLKRFDGEAGEKFRKGCAEYCRNQAFALDALKKQTRKEPKLQQFLTDTESNPMCRRLQLKDLVPSQMQRLTKYPLLIDNLLKHTQSHSDEYKRLERAHERCKHILAYVNQAVKECENYHKLKDMQKKLDRRSIEGSTDNALADLKNLDLTQHKLFYDGPLTWKLRSHRSVEVHALMFDDMIVLLQKQDDKYVLKCQNTNAQPARDEHKYTHSPVLRLQNLLARNLATDKKSFFVVNISESRAQMYEFSAATSEMGVKWCAMINERADELKKDSGKPGVRASSVINAPQLEQVEIERNRFSRKSRKDRSGVNVVKSSPPSLDQVDSLSHLDVGEEEYGAEEEEGLIQPEEVSVSDAVVTEATPVRSPQAKLSPGESSASEGESSSSGVSSQQQQPSFPPAAKPPQSLNVPVPMDQLKSMATEMNEILTKLMAAMNSGSEERHRLRKELNEAQQKLDALKQIQRQMTEAGAIPSGRSSPRAPAAHPTDGTSDIPSLTSASKTLNDIHQQQVAAAQSATTSPASPAQPTAEPVETTDAGEGDGTSGTHLVQHVETTEVKTQMATVEAVHPGIQEATVTQLEESVEALNLSSDPAEIVTVVATETRTSEASAAGLGQEGGEAAMIEVAMGDDDDDDDDDNNEVSVADLPLPDIVSIPETEEDQVSSTRLLDTVDLDDSDTESDDNDTLTSRTSHQEFPSLSTTVEDVVGEEREEDEDEEDRGSVGTLVAQEPDILRNSSSSVIDTEIITVDGGGDRTGDSNSSQGKNDNGDGSSSVDAGSGGT